MERKMGRRSFIKLACALAILEIIPADTILPKGTNQPALPNLFGGLQDVINGQRNQRDGIDPDLNRNRINFLFFVQGETHEPPLIEKATIGSYTLFSLDSEKGVIDQISWTHDLRVPEVEQYLKQNGKGDGRAKKIDEVYRYGGFPLMQRVVESATGLAVDFQMAAEDKIIVDLINQVASGIRIENPKSFWAHKIYFQGYPYPEKYFAKGKQSLDGVTSLQYIKAVPKEDPDPVIEHNRRKYLVMGALKEEISHPTNFLSLIRTLREDIADKTINFDGPFDKLIKRGENFTLAIEVAKYLFGGGRIEDLLPKTGKEIYLVDPTHGDGGMQWVTANAAYNSVSREDLKNGIYPAGVGFEIPFEQRSYFKANPYARDLINEYWLPMRRHIAELLIPTK
ncbi:MAG: LCP family protein [Candidatus Daviesbacteria bacterium]|nr:LCP family protein [Candidatus Daviesbacteria bacterium]